LVENETSPNHLLVEHYAELRALAARLMRDHRRDSVLQPTALANDACVKLLCNGGAQCTDRVELLARAAATMRHLLVDRARARNRLKRSPLGERVAFEKIYIAYENRAVDLIALDEALDRLSNFDAEMSKAVELRFFGGLSMQEVSASLSIPSRTLDRRWEVTSRWLRAQIE